MWNSIPNQTIKYEDRIMTFIDIVGFKKIYILSALRNYRECAPTEWGSKIRKRKIWDSENMICADLEMCCSDPLQKMTCCPTERSVVSWQPLDGSSFGLCFSFEPRLHSSGGPWSTIEQGGDRSTEPFPLSWGLPRGHCLHWHSL